MWKPWCLQLWPLMGCLQTLRVPAHRPRGPEPAKGLCRAPNGHSSAGAADLSPLRLQLMATHAVDRPCIKIRHRALLAPLILVVVPC